MLKVFSVRFRRVDATDVITDLFFATSSKKLHIVCDSKAETAK